MENKRGGKTNAAGKAAAGLKKRASSADKQRRGGTTKPAPGKSVPRKRAKTPPKDAPVQENAAAPRRWRNYARRFVTGCAVAAFLFAAGSVAWTVAYRWFNPPVTWLMLSRHYFDKMPMRREWRGYGQISPELTLAIIAAEDQRFPEHFGLDTVELRNALRKGGRLRGASTITQQTAKNVFLWNGRSWIRKGLEVYFAFLIELFWGKRRILEVYMNVAEMGPGIYGAEAAARHYFGKSAQDLSANESAALAAILPNPLKRSIAEPEDGVRRKKEWILQQMNNLGGTAFLTRIAPRE